LCGGYWPKLGAPGNRQEFLGSFFQKRTFFLSLFILLSHFPATLPRAQNLIQDQLEQDYLEEDRMSNLVLEMRQGDMMVVNGAAIRFRNRTRIELTAHARFLFGRQIMPPHEADSPARRIYYALQTAYIGDDQERLSGMADARARAEEFKQATTSPMAVAILDQAMSCANAGRCYQALRLARRVVQHEDAVLCRGRAAPPKRLPSVQQPTA